jgi:hypothetical protein
VAPTEVSITARYAGSSQAATLRVMPPQPALASLTLSRSQVTAGESVEATVTLAAPASIGGRGVGLGKTDPGGVLTMPAQVVVPAGATTARFTIQTGSVSAPTRLVLWAAAGVVMESALEVLPSSPPPVSAFSLQPDTVIGGGSATGRVTLLYPATPGGRGVGLSTQNPALVTVPERVVVPAGSTQASFSFSTQPVRQPTGVAIWAAAGVIQTAHVVVLPPVGLSSSSPTVKAGENVLMTVVLPAPAPPEGARITLTSSHPELLTAPVTLRVNPGLTYGSAIVWTELAPESTDVTFTGNYGGQTWTTRVTVIP